LKLVGVISTAVLSLTLGVAAPAYAQQEQHDQQQEQKAKPAQGENKTQQDKPAKQEQKTAQQQDKNTKQEEKNAQQQDKNTKHEEKNAQQQTQQSKPGSQAQRANSGRIPDDRFKANFGREHRFRVSQADYSRDRRFQYGGYWFGFVDPWPSNWLYTQEVFVVEINGVYYLCNPMYPGVNIALSFAP
jgi:DNA mismatch repair ATPase MutL